MGVIKRYLLMLVLMAFWACAGAVVADHNGPKLPGVPNTPLIERAVWAEGRVQYCFDSRASTYPGFVAQAKQVYGFAYAVIGVDTEVVAAGAGCDVWLTMPDEFPCGAGTAACIYYNAWPVVAVYNWRLGYSDWRSALCHEGVNTGHALGLHEFYNDRDFTSNGRFDTCMDFGTFVWQITPLDRDNIWSWLLPAKLTSYGLGQHPDGTRFIFYCNGDTKATRVAILKQDFVFGYYWSGQNVLGSDGTERVVGPGQCKGQNLKSANPGDCFYLNQEIGGWAESWQRGTMRNDVAVGCIPYPPSLYTEGVATYYDLEGSPMGCLPLNPYRGADSTIVAIGPERYKEWPCGTRFEICGPASCAVVSRQDSCPGCWPNHFDLSVAASRIVCGVPSTCDVRYRVLPPGIPEARAPAAGDGGLLPQ